MHMGPAGLILRMGCPAMVDCGADVNCYWVHIALLEKGWWSPWVVPWHGWNCTVGMSSVPICPGPPMPGNANPVGHPPCPACAKIQVEDLGVSMVWTIFLRKILQYLSRHPRWSNVGLIKLRYFGDSRPDDLPQIWVYKQQRHTAPQQYDSLIFSGIIFRSHVGI
jgi:hypothetical protein